MTNTNLNYAADGAREVEVMPNGEVREVPKMGVPAQQVAPAKATKLSPHTFGQL